MKIEINIDEAITDMEVVVTCSKLTPKVEKLLAALRMMDCQLTGKKGDEIHLLDIAQIIYIESMERKCFVYTTDDVYESDFPLYELERQLTEYGFFRVSKSFLIHLPSIQSLKADINRRIRITMVNGEQIIASRQYADGLKKRLGVK
ncbi:MAG: LytTR family DNA-binding domain-containing protein [Lachnospiraceae bacterium]|nr:LytTR family DNA-binding domain-containing protein [Lachnospiraceae bacterium]